MSLEQLRRGSASKDHILASSSFIEKSYAVAPSIEITETIKSLSQRKTTLSHSLCSQSLPYLWPQVRSLHSRPRENRYRARSLNLSPSFQAISRGLKSLQESPAKLWYRSANSASSSQTLDAASNRMSGQGNSVAQKEKLGVMLLNLGGPETLDDVQPFLYNLFADPDIIRLPEPLKFLQKPLATIISMTRASKSAEGYKAIGGGSPLRRITEEQGRALKAALDRKGKDAEVYVAMRYWHPYTEEAMNQMKEDGITNLVVLPLYPQFSISTSGSSLRLLQDLLENDPDLITLKHTVIPSWYQRKGYVNAMADMILAELNLFDSPDEIEIFFSAHGVPKSYVSQVGDPYKEEMEECVALIMAELQRRNVMNHHTLAYQSRVGPVEWLKPYTDDSIRELGQKGITGMLAVPISFVSEHIETLEEIDMEYKELAHASGIAQWRRVPALNTNPAFIDDLAEAVLEALPYVGSMIGHSDSLVPIGEVDALLDVFDRDRPRLPTPTVMWEWGFTASAEIWNGRFAMIAVLVILMLETLTGRGILSDLFTTS